MPSNESWAARLGAISRHPIISPTVAGVLTAALLWMFSLDGGDPARTEANAAIPGTTATSSELAESQDSPSQTSPPTTTPSTTTTTVGPLLLVSAATDMDAYGDGWTVALPEPFPADDPGQWPQAAEVHSAQALEWSLQRGALFTYTHLEIVIEGNASSTVTITGARASVVNRKEPNPAAYLTSDSAGAGSAIGWYFDLDSPTPIALEVNPEIFSRDPADLSPFFADQVITVAPGEVVALHVEASTTSW